MIVLYISTSSVRASKLSSVVVVADIRSIMYSPVKREGAGGGESAKKRSKSNTSFDDTEAAFDLAPQQKVISEEMPHSGTGGFSADVPTALDNFATDNATMPKTTQPSMDIKRNSSTTGLALPKKDEKKKVKVQGKQSLSSSMQQKETVGGKSAQATQSDPNKMQDVLFSAGVDIREEEALLSSSVNASKSQTQVVNVQIPKHPPFLHPEQLSAFMRKVCKTQSFPQNFSKNPEVLRMVSTACEMYIKDIVANSLVISRHRRKAVKVNSGRRNEVAMVLRSIAIAEKKDEERRIKKRIALGLEKEDLENKMDSEETLHRASNVTAGLRAGSKKQYGWLTSSTSKPTTLGTKSHGMVAAAVAARGDSGLRFREAREEPGIVMRDLLYALENRRNGVHNVISKGYARIRD
ncbi:hypothetical protein HG536_0H04390 [Torulaspora globosa]|uniref:Transcription initiation factor TFIID subunit 4 n=1 Tax=Torulaspora globosa TaxID=48254 RepID=A0A7G3ZNH7_9SACH|nr:uncharacterized protein HG536_0H04390 [Torulaspora globosa]QLL35063.1 hypothetical protein HG536_0H04390 [Torulaspora globosa]